MCFTRRGRRRLNEIGMKIYHHNDLDGRCAGAIVWRSGECKRDQSCETIEVDYKDMIDVFRTLSASSRTAQF